MQLPVRTPVHLRRIDPGRNVARFYRLTITPTLFGTMSIVRNWGRIGTFGRTRTDLFDESGEAEEALAALERIRWRRGYRDVGGDEI